jgi:transposase InsO family protein
MKFRFINEQRSAFPVEKMCQILKVSRSGFYMWGKRSKSERQMKNEELTNKIGEIFIKSRELYGSPRIYAELKARGYQCSKNRVERLMRGKFIAKTRRKFKITTHSKHDLPVAPDLLRQNFVSDTTNAVWTSDITYIRTNEGWLYLSIILDTYSRKVVGWSMNERLTGDLVIKAINNAVIRRKPNGRIIFHSDRGVQYACFETRKLLARNGFIQSMSRKGICYDNAITESFFHTLKTEHVYFSHFITREEARRSLFDYIEVYYNRERRHSSIGYMSPDQFEKVAVPV